ncbi:MAG TPA: ribokinase [bacterium]|nr:ribokinase [bacterium]
MGSSNIDLIARVPRLPRLGETLVGRSFHLGYGGKGANQAVMAARLGARVTLVAKVGRDVFGEGAARNLKNEGIETTHVLVAADRVSGVAQILVDDSAQNVIVVVPGANQDLRPAEVQRASPAILGADAVVCQLEVPVETTLEAFRIARTGGVCTILNPAPAAPLPDELLDLVDICLPNEPEAEQLTGQSVATRAGVEAAARALLRRGPRAVVVTLGAAGALVVDQGGAEPIPAVAVDAVDPTGAGDAFIGSLAVFLAEGVALREAAHRANAAAALSVTRIGAQESFPTGDEVRAFLARLGVP